MDFREVTKEEPLFAHCETHSLGNDKLYINTNEYRETKTRSLSEQWVSSKTVDQLIGYLLV